MKIDKGKTHMDKSLPESPRLGSTDEMIKEINNFIHFVLDKDWMSNEWKKLELSEDPNNIHPLVAMAFKAHQQIREFILKGTFGMTDEIFELAELSTKINSLKRCSVAGVDKRLKNLTSMDFTLYRTSRYEIQIAGMLLQRNHQVNFIEESGERTPDILVSHFNETCEIECKHKDPAVDQVGYIRSIYNNTQTARKQFSKSCPGIIAIEIDKVRFEEFAIEIERLKEEIFRAMRNSSSISAILLTSKVFMEDKEDYIYRHKVKGFISINPRHAIPEWLSKNLINMDG